MLDSSSIVNIDVSSMMLDFGNIKVDILKDIWIDYSSMLEVSMTMFPAGCWKC
jgi:hypothetical protein